MVAAATVTLLLLVTVVACAPLRRRSAPDQRLAELQTLAGAAAMGGGARDVPLGYGVVDVRRVGKRQSDQRLAQLQTMAALEAMGGKVRQVPIGYGTVDVHKVGRKRAWWGPDAGDWDQADEDVDSAPWWPAVYSS